jgi:hypothetical protein
MKVTHPIAMMALTAACAAKPVDHELATSISHALGEHLPAALRGLDVVDLGGVERVPTAGATRAWRSGGTSVVLHEPVDVL